MPLAPAVLALLLVSTITTTEAQVAPRPESTAPTRPHPAPRPVPQTVAPPANICTTQWGWCQLPTWSAPPGIGCTCLTVDNQEVRGTTRYFPYAGPASPYLQPHSGPPSTIR
jgi:hypothetical protein